MDPLSSLALVVARYGADKVVRALLGDDVGELAGQILGVVSQLEESQARLLEIERKLDVLIDQRHVATLGMGTRYFRQATLVGRDRADRQRDLENAELALVDAAHSAPTPLQRAHGERLLVLVRLARGDRSGALDAWREFDLWTGEATNEAFRRFHAPESEARRQLAQGTYGRETLVDQVYRVFVGDLRWNGAVHEVTWQARLALRELNGLLRDDVAAGRLLGVRGWPFSYLPWPSAFSLQRRSLRFSRDDVQHEGSTGRQVLDIPAGERVSLGGVSCTLSCSAHAGTTPTYVIEADVAVDRHRQSEVLAWVGAGREPLDREQAMAPLPADQHVVRIGGERTIVKEVTAPGGHPPDRIYALVGGLVFSARLE